MDAPEGRSAWPGWAVLVAWVVAWDVLAPKHGYETMSVTWKRWGGQRALARIGLDAAVDWLNGHLCDRY